VETSPANKIAGALGSLALAEIRGELEQPMSQRSRRSVSPETIDLDLYEAVFKALVKKRPGDVILPLQAVAEARRHLPAGSEISDERLVDLLLEVATANQIIFEMHADE